MKPLYDLIHENVKFRYIEKVQTLFRQIEKTIANYVTLTLLNTKIPIFSTVVSSLIGINCNLLQMFNKGKLDVISFIYRISTTKDHKPTFSCRTEKDNLSSKKKFCTDAINQI